MTVCLAALCGAGGDGLGAAVVAADRMVTLGGFIEFEHAIPKMAQPSPRAVAMVAGDTLVGTRLAREVADGFAGTTPRVPDIAAALAQRYVDVRRERIEQEILGPRGLNFGSFYGAHASLNPQITMMIDNTMQQFNLGVELLVAGMDEDGAHVFSIHNPGGGNQQHDVIGYAAIGSGGIHALQSMIGFGHHSDTDLKETVFRVYASKRRAEVAPGVGHDTDMAVISATGIAWLTAQQLKALEVVYETFENTTEAALLDRLEGFDLKALPDEDAARWG
jgi:hypothetical protein